MFTFVRFVRRPDGAVGTLVVHPVSRWYAVKLNVACLGCLTEWCVSNAATASRLARACATGSGISSAGPSRASAAGSGASSARSTGACTSGADPRPGSHDGSARTHRCVCGANRRADGRSGGQCLILCQVHGRLTAHAVVKSGQELCMAPLIPGDLRQDTRQQRINAAESAAHRGVRREHVGHL